MNRALWVAKTGLETQSLRMAIVSNNLANVSTNGYKKSRGLFQDLLYQNVRQPGAKTSENTTLPSGLMLGSGVRTTATQKIFTQGNFIQTENTYDMGIQGRGFFQILMPDGTINYTRDGAFQVDANGLLVTSSGYQLQPSVQIPFNAQSFTVGADGVVTVQEAGSPDAVQVGQIQLADFINPAGLESLGDNLYAETTASGPPQIGNPGVDSLGTLIQGSVESSNVNVVEELVNMIETQRAYEMNSKAISAVDGMLRNLNQNL